MKKTYPVILTPDETGYVVYIPDWELNTEGETIEEALYMAKDAIELAGVCYEDDKKKIPEPKTLKPQCKKDEIVSLVSADFDLYRERLDNRSVRKNCTIPAWLEREANSRKINYSAVLQEALRKIIGDGNTPRTDP